MYARSLASVYTCAHNVRTCFYLCVRFVVVPGPACRSSKTVAVWRRVRLDCFFDDVFFPRCLGSATTPYYKLAWLIHPCFVHLILQSEHLHRLPFMSVRYH